MVKQLHLNFKTFQGLCEFVLMSVAEDPLPVREVAARYLEEKDFKNSWEFIWLFSRCIAKMLDESWIVKTEVDLYKMGLSSRGSTVLRHKTEIPAFYGRYFASDIKNVVQAKKQVQAKRKKQLKAGRKAKSVKRGARRSAMYGIHRSPCLPLCPKRQAHLIAEG